MEDEDGIVLEEAAIGGARGLGEAVEVLVKRASVDVDAVEEDELEVLGGVLGLQGQISGHVDPGDGAGQLLQGAQEGRRGGVAAAAEGVEKRGRGGALEGGAMQAALWGGEVGHVEGGAVVDEGKALQGVLDAAHLG